MVKPACICTIKTILLIKPACTGFATGTTNLYKLENIVTLLL